MTCPDKNYLKKQVFNININSFISNFRTGFSFYPRAFSEEKPVIRFLAKKNNNLLKGQSGISNVKYTVQMFGEQMNRRVSRA